MDCGDDRDLEGFQAEEKIVVPPHETADRQGVAPRKVCTSAPAMKARPSP